MNDSDEDVLERFSKPSFKSFGRELGAPFGLPSLQTLQEHVGSGIYALHRQYTVSNQTWPFLPTTWSVEPKEMVKSVDADAIRAH